MPSSMLAREEDAQSPLNALLSSPHCKSRDVELSLLASAPQTRALPVPGMLRHRGNWHRVHVERRNSWNQQNPGTAFYRRQRFHAIPGTFRLSRLAARYPLQARCTISGGGVHMCVRPQQVARKLESARSGKHFQGFFSVTKIFYIYSQVENIRQIGVSRGVLQFCIKLEVYYFMYLLLLYIILYICIFQYICILYIILYLLEMFGSRMQRLDRCEKLIIDF